MQMEKYISPHVVIDLHRLIELNGYLLTGISVYDKWNLKVPGTEV
ncbi:hypothetical protein [Sporosarcina sp. Te-1]|nr:hypothetical protein [Sporosarcina sp. Te-1]